ncbi:GTP:AMP phosphotransferase mitochondrial [Fasciola hepatica]|uniref:GTP:AMP phosphotransferase mitochondrial n=1 Tax=Fasciola hepatica TaxID=6192 RepID=A0A4E0RAI7_FASHE|nr:GTP:AMP phosphotransferase mitochondrial [Fasciola hepatica]
MKAAEFMNKGQLVPDSVVTSMMLGECEKLTKSNLLLDGFPRTLEQAKSLDKTLSVTCVLNLDVPFDEIINRIKCRWVHLPSGRIYNDEFNPPKKKGFDDVTGEPLTQRDDDKPEAVRTRLEAYQRMMQPLIDHYTNQNLLHSFRGRYSNELWPHVHKALSQYLKPLQYTEYK